MLKCTNGKHGCKTNPHKIYKVRRPTALLRMWTNREGMIGMQSLNLRASSPSHLANELHSATLASHANHALRPRVPDCCRLSQLFRGAYAAVTRHLSNQRVAPAHPSELTSDGRCPCHLRFDPFQLCCRLTRPERSRSAQLRRTGR